MVLFSEVFGIPASKNDIFDQNRPNALFFARLYAAEEAGEKTAKRIV